MFLPISNPYIIHPPNYHPITNPGGLTIKGHTSPNSFVTLHGIAPEFAAAIREDLADIDRQREAWEAKQTTTANEGTQQGQARTTAAKTDNTQTDIQNADSERDTAPADGLTLEDTAEGVAVVGNSRTTYKHRREIKAHGARWNREAQQWQATDPDDVARLRAWFALREQDEPTATTEQADTMSDTTTATPLEDGQDITDPTDEPEADQPADLSPLMEAVADVLRIFSDIMQQAKQWEGVTIPAVTLERWKQEANEGTKTAAARLCEVCACLASLTPESRQDFDALGGIFWSLSQQLKQGTDPATLQGATDYARAQLFDLIDRTQTKNQVRAIREANRETRESKAEAPTSFAESGTRKPTGNEPDSEHRTAA